MNLWQPLFDAIEALDAEYNESGWTVKVRTLSGEIAMWETTTRWKINVRRELSRGGMAPLEFYRREHDGPCPPTDMALAEG